jgi:hypothetical protein
MSKISGYRSKCQFSDKLLGGDGEGRIESSPPGAECEGIICRGRFAEGTHVTLTPIPNPGSAFDSWYGKWTNVNVDGICTVYIYGNPVVHANFKEKKPK